MIFGIFEISQKSGWNKTDYDYRKNKGWLNGEKLFKKYG